MEEKPRFLIWYFQHGKQKCCGPGFHALSGKTKAPVSWLEPVPAQIVLPEQLTEYLNKPKNPLIYKPLSPNNERSIFLLQWNDFRMNWPAVTKKMAFIGWAKTRHIVKVRNTIQAFTTPLFSKISEDCWLPYIVRVFEIPLKTMKTVFTSFCRDRI